jgi:hypothetical protein
MVIRDMFIQPRRIQFEVLDPPPQLPVSLQIACNGDFVFGWLQVPENIQTSIATAAQRIRIVGPSYWAVPLPHAPEIDRSTRRTDSTQERASEKPATSKPATPSKPPPPPAPAAKPAADAAPAAA